MSPCRICSVGGRFSHVRALLRVGCVLVMISVVGCVESSATDPSPARLAAAAGAPTQNINSSFFDSYSCFPGYRAKLTADLDGDTTVLWSGSLGKKFTASLYRVSPAGAVSQGSVLSSAWKNNYDDPLDGARTSIYEVAYDPNSTDLTASLTAQQSYWDNKSTTFRAMTRRDSSGVMLVGCSSLHPMTILSPVPYEYLYATPNEPSVWTKTTWLAALNDTFSIGVRARHAFGKDIPLETRDVFANPTSTGALAATSSTSNVQLVTSPSFGPWNIGSATFRAASVGAAKLRWSLRGKLDSSFAVTVCAPSKEIPVSFYLSPSGPVSAIAFERRFAAAYATNCANRGAPGAATVTSLDPSVVQVYSATSSSAGITSIVYDAVGVGTARLVATKTLTDTLVVNVAAPVLVTEMAGPWSVRSGDSCAWQVYVTGMGNLTPNTFSFAWTKDGLTLSSTQAGSPQNNPPLVTSYVLGVPSGSQSFTIQVDISHPSGLWDPITVSRVISIDENAPACSE